jgi:hypothetical protein
MNKQGLVMSVVKDIEKKKYIFVEKPDGELVATFSSHGGLEGGKPGATELRGAINSLLEKTSPELQLTVKQIKIEGFPAYQVIVPTGHKEQIKKALWKVLDKDNQLTVQPDGSFQKFFATQEEGSLLMAALAQNGVKATLQQHISDLLPGFVAVVPAAEKDRLQVAGFSVRESNVAIPAPAATYVAQEEISYTSPNRDPRSL